jgi:hypothetical protein
MGAEVPRKREAGYGTSTLPLNALMTAEFQPDGFRKDLPALVYLYTTQDDEKRQDFEFRVFADERVGFTSRFFNCIRIWADTIPDPEARKKYASDLPMLVLFDSAGNEVKTYNGTKLDGSRLLSAMQRTFEQHFQGHMAKLLVKMNDIFQALDETYYDMLALEDGLKATREHLDRHDCNMGRRQVAEIEEEMAEVKKDRAKALADEKKLLDDVVLKKRSADEDSKAN